MYLYSATWPLNPSQLYKPHPFKWIPLYLSFWFKLLNLFEEKQTSPACARYPVGLAWYFSQHSKFWEDSIHTIGQQVVLLQWIEGRSTPKAWLASQGCMSNSVLGSRSSMRRLHLILIPGGFTSTWKTFIWTVCHLSTFYEKAFSKFLLRVVIINITF